MGVSLRDPVLRRGGRHLPPVSDSLTEISYIPSAVKKKFDLISINVISDGSLCQALGTGLPRIWTSIEGGIWVDERGYAEYAVEGINERGIYRYQREIYLLDPYSEYERSEE